MTHGRGRRGYGSELSPREREVVRLVAQGKTNRDIAELLFLSKRTVDSHVATAMRKLGVRSRREINVSVRDTDDNAAARDHHAADT